MDGMEKFARLARIARGERAPAVDVRHAVMARLRREEISARDNLWAALACAGSGVAALVFGMLGYGAWLALNEPLAEYFLDLTNLGAM